MRGRENWRENSFLLIHYTNNANAWGWAPQQGAGNTISISLRVSSHCSAVPISTPQLFTQPWSTHRAMCWSWDSGTGVTVTSLWCGCRCLNLYLIHKWNACSLLTLSLIRWWESLEKQEVRINFSFYLFFYVANTYWWLQVSSGPTAQPWATHTPLPEIWKWDS